MPGDKEAVTFIVFLLFLSVWKAGASTEGCPDIVLRSPHYAKVHDGTCYLFVDRERYWNDARSACWNMGGEMLSIRDESTMQFIRLVLNSRQLRWFREGVWLGARYVRGRWRWTTGVTLGYNNWAPGEPSKLLGIFSVEDCALMRRGDNWRWHDYLCGSLKFHYNYICEFPFNSDGHHEAHTGSQTRDNGNLTVLIIILTSGGIVLLILLLVFIVVRRRYNYKKLTSEPDVHFDNRSYDLAVRQPVVPSHSSRSVPLPSARLSNSRPSSSLYAESVEMEPASLKPNSTTISLSKESTHRGESASTSLSCSNEDLGACGGASSGEEKAQAAVSMLPLSGAAERSSPTESKRDGRQIELRTIHKHSDYVHMNGSPLTSPQNGHAVKPGDGMVEEKERGSKEGGGGGGGDGDQPGSTGGEENEPPAVPSYSDDTAVSKSQ